MRRHRIAAVAAVFALAAAAVPQHAEAQQNSQLRGTWTLDAGRSDDVNARINEAVARMNFVTRPIARGRLRATNTAYPRLVMSFDAQNVRVEMQDRPTAVSPANGQPVLWNRTTGQTCTRVSEDCVQLTTAWENGRLVQAFRPEDGERRNVYSVSADGSTMTMAVTITSPRLPRPLTYNLVYNRAS